jgi:arginine/lysine/ornithine decarboxylase
MADDETIISRLLQALERLIGAAPAFELPPAVHLPDPDGLELESVVLPRDAFFGPKEALPAAEAVGRIAAEQVTPYPPGIPVIVPGERINTEVVEYLRTGLDAGMVLPDASDRTLKTLLVTTD